MGSVNPDTAINKDNVRCHGREIFDGNLHCPAGCVEDIYSVNYFFADNANAKMRLFYDFEICLLSGQW